MLEEIKYDYKVTSIDISKEEQFKPEFKKISPFNKIPAITDRQKNVSLFESGAILIYLGEQSRRFYDEDKKTIINQWLMAQMAYVGPMLGQHLQFHHYNQIPLKHIRKSYYLMLLQDYNYKPENLNTHG